MRLYHLAVVVVPMCASPVLAQAVRDAASIAQDQNAPAPRRDAGPAGEVIVAPDAPASVPADLPGGLLIGAVIVEGAPALPREAFAPVIADYVGRLASTQDLQELARAVAAVARKRGFVFATAAVPAQTVNAGMVTVRIDEGDIALVRMTGSKNARVQRILDRITGRGVRREVLERQLLLAGDVPGIQIASTRLVHEDIGNVLLVEVREKNGHGAFGIDTYGQRNLGPVRARLRYDFIGLADVGDSLTLQAVATPADPRQLTYVSGRYALSLGTGGTQLAFTGSYGRAAPSRSGFNSNSTHVGILLSTPLKRANRVSIWANAEIGLQRVVGTYNGEPDLRDSTATATGWLYATSRIGNSRLSGGLGVTRGFALAGATGPADPRASRPDASGVFTKGFFWTDWVQPLGSGLSVRIAANGQLADRPLLATQEIGLGGPSFGRAFDFWERFGDSGVMASGELRWRQSEPLDGVDWVEPFAQIDTGHIWNLEGGFGGGDLTSTGGGVRAAFGKLRLSVEAAVPINTVRAATRDKTPRVNVSVERRF
ncbi:ShlB/FhaC/HecB family hemolysin secretion/activation protein [Novosphingobium sp. Chol11]|uniref:ShlB/FhaC/HecB family hemolysin secretion/activation protein n=1 Tax=Novosphingobium sp. Chol11 TaxID=1385763 RepID=UPI0026014B9A|nr:ShlB/FhaC/HecB family hemolysin secretion/activation protein [Novosphingobium sp. Chol11]